jgi:hypothetical protein
MILAGDQFSKGLHYKTLIISAEWHLKIFFCQVKLSFRGLNSIEILDNVYAYRALLTLKFSFLLAANQGPTVL